MWGNPWARLNIFPSLCALFGHTFSAHARASDLNVEKSDESPTPAQSCATGVLFPPGQFGRMNNGIEAFRSQLQKELGLSIGPKDPLLALWVSQKELLEQNAAQQQKLLSEFQVALGRNQTA
jgi:hypothetical protein